MFRAGLLMRGSELFCAPTVAEPKQRDLGGWRGLSDIPFERCLERNEFRSQGGEAHGGPKRLWPIAKRQPGLLHHEDFGIFSRGSGHRQHGQAGSSAFWHGGGDLRIIVEFERGGITWTEGEGLQAFGWAEVPA